MNNIIIKTLTPVHIGTGRDLQGSMEYLWFPDTRQAVVLDEEKVLGILGAENINQWVSCIERLEPLLPLLRQRKNNLQPGDLAKRSIPLGGTPFREQKALREQLHSANGQAMLPGSSLKGSARTAVWATVINQKPELVQVEDNLGDTDKSGKLKYKDAPLVKKIFGSDPNHDIFRLLSVGDALFPETQCYLTEVANYSPTKDEWILDSDIEVQVEAIPAGKEATLNWRYNEVLEKSARTKNLFNGNAALLRPEKLFATINAHTKHLVENEIKYWRGDGGMPLSIGQYVDEMKSILAKLEQCGTNACILRLGWGTGYRNMTGDWQINLADDVYYDLVKKVRTTHPEDMIFPKTTRFVSGGIPLGFVCLEATG